MGFEPTIFGYQSTAATTALISPGWNQYFDCRLEAISEIYHVNRYSLTDCSQDLVAHLVELQTSNPKVVGSSHTFITEFIKVQMVIY